MSKEGLQKIIQHEQNDSLAAQVFFLPPLYAIQLKLPLN